MTMLVCKNVCIKVTPPFRKVLEAEAQFIVMPEEFGVLRNFRQEDLSHLQRTLCDNMYRFTSTNKPTYWRKTI